MLELATLVVLILAILALVTARRAEARIALLDGRLAELEGELGATRARLRAVLAPPQAAPATAPAVASAPPPTPPVPAIEADRALDAPLPAPLAAPRPAVVAAAVTGTDRSAASSTVAFARLAGQQGRPHTLTLEQRIGARWSTWVAIVALLFAIGFFVRWSFENELIGPGGRVTLGIVSGVAMLGAGLLLRRRTDLPYLSVGLSGGGLGALYLSLYAAHALYGFLGAAAAFAAMFAVTLGGSAVAVASRQQVTAVLAVIGGLLTPILVSTAHPDERVLLGYLVILDVLVLVVARYRNWAGLNRLSWVGTVLLLIPVFAQTPESAHPLARLVLLGTIFVLFIGVPLVRAWAERGRVEGLDLALVVSNAGAYALGAYVTLEPWRPSAEGPLALALAALYTRVAMRYRRRVPEDEVAEQVHLATAAVLGTIAIPLMLDGPWITLAWAAQGVAFTWLATRTRSGTATVGGPVLLILALVRAAFLDPLRHPAHPPLWNAMFLVHLGVVAALALAGTLVGRATDGTDESSSEPTMRSFHWAMAAALLGVLLWREPFAPWPAAWLAAEMVALAWLARRLSDAGLEIAAPLLALVVVARVVVDVQGTATEPPIWNLQFLAHLLAVAGLVLAGSLAGSARAAKENRTLLPLREGFWFLAALLFAMLLWREPPGLWPGRLLSAEVILLAWLARTRGGVGLVSATPVLASLVLLRVFLEDDSAARQAADTLVNAPFLLQVMGCCAIGCAGALLDRQPAPTSDRTSIVGKVLKAVAAAGLLAASTLAWTRHVQWKMARADDEARIADVARLRWQLQVGLSVMWTLYGAAVMGWGFARSSVGLRYAALALLGFVVVKVFLVDLSELDAIYRILSFAVLGIVLLGVSFVYQKRKADWDRPSGA